jgi:hypothetical protein
MAAAAAAATAAAAAALGSALQLTRMLRCFNTAVRNTFRTCLRHLLLLADAARTEKQRKRTPDSQRQRQNMSPMWPAPQYGAAAYYNASYKQALQMLPQNYCDYAPKQHPQKLTPTNHLALHPTALRRSQMDRQQES